MIDDVLGVRGEGFAPYLLIMDLRRRVMEFRLGWAVCGIWFDICYRQVVLSLLVYTYHGVCNGSKVFMDKRVPVVLGCDINLLVFHIVVI